MESERRRWSRVDCDASKQGVLLRLETQDPTEAVLNTMARNVSLGGLSCEVGKDVALPDPLPLKVFLPHPHTPLDCSSRIAWQKLIPPPVCSPKARRRLIDVAGPAGRQTGGGMNEQTAHIGVAFQQLPEEQQDTLKDFLREVGGTTATVELEPAEVEEAQATPPRQGSRCDQAIQQFEQGVLLYHQRKLGLAKREFQKVLKEYADVIDVARVARRYHDWCHMTPGLTERSERKSVGGM